MRQEDTCIITDQLQLAVGEPHVCRQSCITSGGLTVMNVYFTNSPEHPTHCPTGSFLTVYRKKGCMTNLRLYHALHHNTQITSESA